MRFGFQVTILNLSLFCSVTAFAIKGGDPSPALIQPTQVRVNSATGFCSGTLIAPSIVITAAHCHLAFGIGVGSTARILDETLQVIDVSSPPYAVKSKMLKADGGSGEGLEPDLVLLRLAQKSVVGKPAKLASFVPKEGDVVRVAGCGEFSATPFDFIELNTLPQTVEGTLGALAAPMTADNLDPVVPAFGNNVMFGIKKPGASICPGDSGGPIYLPDSNGMILLAVTSGAPIVGPETECLRMGMGPSIASNLHWISEQARKWGETVKVASPPAPPADKLITNRVAFERLINSLSNDPDDQLLRAWNTFTANLDLKLDLGAKPLDLLKPAADDVLRRGDRYRGLSEFSEARLVHDIESLQAALPNTRFPQIKVAFDLCDRPSNWSFDHPPVLFIYMCAGQLGELATFADQALIEGFIHFVTGALQDSPMVWNQGTTAWARGLSRYFLIHYRTDLYPYDVQHEEDWAKDPKSLPSFQDFNIASTENTPETLFVEVEIGYRAVVLAAKDNADFEDLTRLQMSEYTPYLNKAIDQILSELRAPQNVVKR